MTLSDHHDELTIIWAGFILESWSQPQYLWTFSFGDLEHTKNRHTQQIFLVPWTIEKFLSKLLVVSCDNVSISKINTIFLAFLENYRYLLYNEYKNEEHFLIYYKIHEWMNWKINIYTESLNEKWKYLINEYIQMIQNYWLD